MEKYLKSLKRSWGKVSIIVCVCILLSLYTYNVLNVYDCLSEKQYDFTESLPPLDYIQKIADAKTAIYFVGESTWIDVYTIEKNGRYIEKYVLVCNEKTNNFSFLDGGTRLVGYYRQPISKKRYKYLTKLSYKICNKEYIFGQEELFAPTAIYIAYNGRIKGFSEGYVTNGEILYDTDGMLNPYFDENYSYIHNFVRDMVINSSMLPPYRKDTIYEEDYIKKWKEDIQVE